MEDLQTDDEKRVYKRKGKSIMQAQVPKIKDQGFYPNTNKGVSSKK